ncbi:hypothetical protein BC830DRAFT_1165516 [Chytriomyces sp. MP71]|nr:hypothetical protein BC830DRAFT_1165516 [Chytriomyces sp. MP71]
MASTAASVSLASRRRAHASPSRGALTEPTQQAFAVLRAKPVHASAKDFVCSAGVDAAAESDKRDDALEIVRLRARVASLEADAAAASATTSATTVEKRKKTATSASLKIQRAAHSQAEKAVALLKPAPETVERDIEFIELAKSLSDLCALGPLSGCAKYTLSTTRSSPFHMKEPHSRVVLATCSRLFQLILEKLNPPEAQKQQRSQEDWIQLLTVSHTISNKIFGTHSDLTVLLLRGITSLLHLLPTITVSPHCPSALTARDPRALLVRIISTAGRLHPAVAPLAVFGLLKHLHACLTAQQPGGGIAAQRAHENMARVLLDALREACRVCVRGAAARFGPGENAIPASADLFDVMHEMALATIQVLVSRPRTVFSAEFVHLALQVLLGVDNVVASERVWRESCRGSVLGAGSDIFSLGTLGRVFES